MTAEGPHSVYCEDCGSCTQLVMVHNYYRDIKWVCNSCAKGYIFDPRNAAAHDLQLKKFREADQ